jgi:hypothetical protein
VSDPSERPGRLDEAERELLADYVGGALDGTPAEAAVAALVETDPAWADTLEEMITALGAVDADLVAYAANPEPMPADVTARLEAALAAAGPATAAERTTVPDHDGGRATTSGTVGRSRGRLTVVPTAHPPTARRRRWPAWAAGVGVAAAVIACAGFSINWFGQQAGTSNTDTQTAGSAAAPEKAAAADSAGMTVTMTGRGYSRASLARAPMPFLSAAPSDVAKSSSNPTGVDSGDGQAGGTARAAAGLTRLGDRSALDACLDAIALAHARGALTVQSVDYGTFEDTPAVIVFFTDAAGERWGWASGANCGVAGPDELYQTRVA